MGVPENPDLTPPIPADKPSQSLEGDTVEGRMATPDAHGHSLFGSTDSAGAVGSMYLGEGASGTAGTFGSSYLGPNAQAGTGLNPEAYMAAGASTFTDSLTGPPIIAEEVEADDRKA
jgi:hypothetical protein